MPVLFSTSLADEVTALYHSHQAGLVRYLLSFGLSVQDCEEVAQEVFLSLFQHLRHGKPRDNLRGWIFRVGHNLALKQRKRSSREIELEDEQFRDLGIGPEERLTLVQQQARLLAAVRALSRQDQCCLHLRAEGLRYREIAEVLGMSLGAVAASLGRTMAKLSRVEERSR